MERTENNIIPQRLMCVDALRGFDMLWIVGGSNVFVSFAKASGNDFLNSLTVNFEHEWGHFHFYDIIMPLFLFIVGVVMPFSFRHRLSESFNKRIVYRHIFKRFIILWIVGLVANGHLLELNNSTLHLWTDTLHAIAVAYVISSVMVIELKLKWQILITAFLLIGYWLVLTFVPIPGHGPGIYEPNLNLPLYIDDKILGHYQEGMGWTYILTNMTFICSVMLGTFAGRILISQQLQMKKVMQLALLGVCCVIVGRIWGIWFPIIHHIWTSSLVLYATGWSFLLLSLFYLVIDVWGYRKWSFFFVVIGMNAIAVYVATHLFNFKLIGNIFVAGIARFAGPFSEFVQETAALGVIWLILYWMYRKKTFIKI